MNSGKQLDCEDLSHEEKANSPFGVIGFVESLEEKERGGPFAQFTDPQFFQRRICVRCNLSKTKKY